MREGRKEQNKNVEFVVRFVLCPVYALHCRNFILFVQSNCAFFVVPPPPSLLGTAMHAPHLLQKHTQTESPKRNNECIPLSLRSNALHHFCHPPPLSLSLSPPRRKRDHSLLSPPPLPPRPITPPPSVEHAACRVTDLHPPSLPLSHTHPSLLPPHPTPPPPPPGPSSYPRDDSGGF